MDLREMIALLGEQRQIHHVSDPQSPWLEAARIIHRAGERAVRFVNLGGWTAVANVFAKRNIVAQALGVAPKGLLARVAGAVARPGELVEVGEGPCQEVNLDPADLQALPILHHLEGDGGAYVTSGVMVYRDPDLGMNLSYHRLLRLDQRRFVARVVEGRGLHRALGKAPNLEVAICLGGPIQFHIAAALSPAPGINEMAVAAALGPLPLVRCRKVDLAVPAQCEIILEGRFTGELAPEGPFIDITGTWDIVRPQPVLEIQAITTRRDPIYQALLPAGPEHRLLMGMPKEIDIYAAVGQVAPCLDVTLTPGGCGWLHGVIQLGEVDGQTAKNAIEAAFQAHPSMKLCIAVNQDIPVDRPDMVEWAVATRFQAHRDMVVLEGWPSSSLDPSADLTPGQKARGSKLGLVAMVPLGREPEFRRLSYDS